MKFLATVFLLAEGLIVLIGDTSSLAIEAMSAALTRSILLVESKFFYTELLDLDMDYAPEDSSCLYSGFSRGTATLYLV